MQHSEVHWLSREGRGDPLSAPGIHARKNFSPAKISSLPAAFCLCVLLTPLNDCAAGVAKGQHFLVFGCRGEQLPWQ